MVRIGARVVPGVLQAHHYWFTKVIVIMEKLSVEKRTEVSKMSTERLRARLTKAGYDEDEVFEMDRSELLSTYAEYLLSPPISESAEKATFRGMSAEELELRRRKEERLHQELELRKEELQMQREMTKQELERQEKEEVR